MKTVTITQKDIEKAKIQFTDSGYIIDELAYSAGQWTSNQMDENNMEYEPNEPYNFDFEADLLANTKTSEQLSEILQKLGQMPYPYDSKELQAGAHMALNNAGAFDELLQAYTDALRDEGREGISESYNKALEDEITSFQEDLYKQWLNGDRISPGVVYEIAKYFTDERNGSWDQKAHAYTFTLNDEDIQNIKEKGYRANQLKRALLGEIYDSAKARQAKEEAERRARQAERERLAQYKKEQSEKAEAERRAKLLALKKDI